MSAVPGFMTGYRLSIHIINYIDKIATMVKVRKRTGANSKGKRTAWVADYFNQDGKRIAVLLIGCCRAARLCFEQAWMAPISVPRSRSGSRSRGTMRSTSRLS